MTDTSKHEPVIGLEIHAQLSTNTKAFSNDSAEFGGTPNSNISAITLGHPGTLPKLNFKIIDYAIKMGLALNCTINKLNRFARKNYFYADLPKGYQISQFETPICSDGYMKLGVNGEEKKIGITRVHMEEDSGKSNHEQDPYYSLIDLNRAGVPLIEIVSEPDMRSADEAFEFVSEIRRMVRYLDICDGNMEEGSLRCDANVSVRLKGADKFGEKVEVKNMNSIRNVKKAIEYEIQRQIEAIEKGEKITQDTRSFDAAKGVTFTMRSKEMAHDYRYFTEPDLPPVKLTQEHIDKLKKDMPIMPDEHLARLTGELKLDEYDAKNIISTKGNVELFEEALPDVTNYKLLANVFNGPLRAAANEQAVETNELGLTGHRLAEYVNLIDAGLVSGSTAHQRVFPVMIENPDKNPKDIATEMNLIQEGDVDEIQKLVEKVLAEFPDKVEEYKKGKEGLLGFFVGQVMKLSGNKSDPKIVNKLILKMLKSN